MTDKPTIAHLLATGRMEFETPAGWQAADLGLRGEVIAAALETAWLGGIQQAIVKRRPIRFRDPKLDLTVRWSPE